MTAGAASRRSVLCVVDSQKGHATAGVRGAFYRRLFQDEGWDFEARDAARERPSGIVRAARGRDWVILIKVSSLALTRALRGSGALLAFDFSDALWQRLHRRAGWHDLERILAEVDAVFCENDFLVPFARRRNPQVFTGPTSVPLAAFDAARAAGGPRDPGRLRLGWVGSRTTLPGLAKLRAPLANLAARHPQLEVRVLGASGRAVAAALPGVPVRVLEEYDEPGMIGEMLGFDVGLYPAPFDAEDYASRGPLKALLYMAAGLPVACDAGGDCSVLMRNGESGVLVAKAEEWEGKLEALLVDPGLRRRLGSAALERARESQRAERLFGAVRAALHSVRREARPARSLPARARDAVRSLGFRLDAFGARALRAVRKAARRASGRQP